jgi:hypothetical protein
MHNLGPFVTVEHRFSRLPSTCCMYLAQLSPKVASTSIDDQVSDAKLVDELE